MSARMGSLLVFCVAVAVLVESSLAVQFHCAGRHVAVGNSLRCIVTEVAVPAGFSVSVLPSTIGSISGVAPDSESHTVEFEFQAGSKSGKALFTDGEGHGFEVVVTTTEFDDVKVVCNDKEIIPHQATECAVRVFNQGEPVFVLAQDINVAIFLPDRVVTEIRYDSSVGSCFKFILVSSEQGPVAIVPKDGQGTELPPTTIIVNEDPYTPPRSPPVPPPEPLPPAPLPPGPNEGTGCELMIARSGPESHFFLS